MGCMSRDFSTESVCAVAAIGAGGGRISGETAFEFVRWRGETPVSHTWTRADLRAVVAAEAVQLAARTQPGDRVIVAHPPGPAFVAGFLACLASGRIAVPAAAPLTAASKAAVARLEDASGAALVLSGGERLAPDASADSGRDHTFDAPAQDDIAYLQFTSGSTQAPRGAVITHRALRANLAAIGDAWALGADDRGVFWLPPFHDMGLVGAILAPLAFGVPSTLMHPAAFLQRPARWLQLMSDRRATFSGGPNFAYDLVAERVAAADLAGLDLSAWRVAVNGAEPVRRRTMRRFATALALAPTGFRDGAFAPGYGLAESVLFVSARRTTETASPCAGDDETPVDCGPPGHGVTVQIVDETTQRALPDGETGAIWVAGDSVAAGYWNAPDATAATFDARLPGDARAWLRTGDIGLLREGRLHVCGRAKDVLIRGGRKVHAADVEAVVAAALGRRVPAAAFALSGAAQEESIAVIVEYAPDDADACFATLVDAIAAALDLTPDVIALCGPGAVRLTTSGKIARAATRDAWCADLLPVRAVWRRPVSPAVSAAVSPADSIAA